jgi:hypothetical protein
LNFIYFYTIITFNGIDEAAAKGSGELLPQHDPMSRVKTAAEATMSMRVRGAPPPWAQHGAEAEIVGYVLGEDELGDQSGRPIRKISPISPALTKKHGLEDRIGSSEEYEEILMGKWQPTTRLEPWRCRARREGFVFVVVRAVEKARDRRCQFLRFFLKLV